MGSLRSKQPTGADRSIRWSGLPAQQRFYSLVVATAVLLGVHLVLTAAQPGASLACPTKTLTGLPCPACGLTRACLALLQGAWAEAWLLHPLAFVLTPLGLAGLGLLMYDLATRAGLLLRGYRAFNRWAAVSWLRRAVLLAPVVLVWLGKLWPQLAPWVGWAGRP